MSIINIKNQHGFTMIEVLIAAVVLGIGLLGLAGLQAQSLQLNYSAYQRSQANLLAYDIIDRIRANQAHALIGNNNYTLGISGGLDCQAVAANCTPAQMASFDIRQWKCSLGGLNGMAPCAGLGIEGPLAEGDGTVVINVAAGRAQIIVTITWVDNRTIAVGDPGRTETFTVSSAL